MINNYSINNEVRVHITHCSRMGLFGKLDDDVKTIIRTREISWNSPQPLESYVNRSYDALVIGYDPIQNQLELSLRFKDHDPWKDAESRYVPGTEVEGIVVGLIEDAAFVEIERGIDAYLPRSELTSLPPQHIEELLWINDHVKAKVVDIASQKRRIRISIREQIAERERKFKHEIWSSQLHGAASGVTIAEYIPKQTRLSLLRIGDEDRESNSSAELHVLVIEDDDVFGLGLSSFLQANGCQVVLVNDSLSGLAWVERRTPAFDLIILDWNLPTLKGHEVIEQLYVLNIPSRVVTILEPSYLQNFPEIWNAVLQSNSDILSKSDNEYLMSSILSILRELRHVGADQHSGMRPSITRPAEAVFPERISARASEVSTADHSYDTRLSSIIDQLLATSHASTVAIVYLDPTQPMPAVELWSGKALALQDASPDVLYSPLGDLLQDRQEVFLDVKSGSSRFDRLLSLFVFKGFIGVPITVSAAVSYGLLLIREDRKFDTQDLEKARSAAVLVGEILRDRRFLQIFRPWQAQNLIGQLSNSIVHEVNNKLSGMELLVQRLRNGIHELTREPEKAEDATFLRGLDEAVEGIGKAQKAASALRNWYLGITTTDISQDVDLFKLAFEMKQALHGQAQENNIMILLVSPRNLPALRTQPNQLQQIFLNLILNAIQIMAVNKRVGKITIELAFEPDAQLPYKVRFRDEGPGIHQRLIDRIFDFGFTTKKGGAGLGLTISRQVAQSCGGRLSVESSHVLWGTTFLLELSKT